MRRLANLDSLEKQ